jgi:hypothetical protein
VTVVELQPTELSVIAVAGSPFTLLLTMVITAGDDTIDWSEFTDPRLRLRDRGDVEPGWHVLAGAGD